MVSREVMRTIEEENLFPERRRRMVEEQIAIRGVRDERVLAAMGRVPRHLFIDKDLESNAYEDFPLGIGEGQTISQPYIVAYMTEQLGLKGDERVLEVGAGCGYQTAILAELCEHVYAIEYFPTLAERAKRTLARLGIGNVSLRVGDGRRGWPEAAPFDAILAAAAAASLPDALVEQLAPGGRMVLPLGKWRQVLKRIEKTDSEIRIKKLLDVRFVPLLESREG